MWFTNAENQGYKVPTLVINWCLITLFDIILYKKTYVGDFDRVFNADDGSGIRNTPSPNIFKKNNFKM